MQAVRPFLAAVAFLTRIPIRLQIDGADVARGAVFFPLVGAGIGAAVGGTVYGLAQVLPALPAAALGIAVGVVLTGALHLDGLADTADALGGMTRDRALEIMRDHRIGAYGAIALMLDLLVKTTALAGLANGGHVVRSALAAGALSRAVPVVLGRSLRSVREDGAGAAFRVSTTAACLAALIGGALALVGSAW